jgi:porphobilinogen synthase
MMDGQVAAIRDALDGAGHLDVAILAYAAKYASASTARSATRSTSTIADGGDRKGYQQDWRNAREAQREIDLDLAEGADIVMVKPAWPTSTSSPPPAPPRRAIAAYHVSGEYAMIKAADARLDRRRRRCARAAHRRSSGPAPT